MSNEPQEDFQVLHEFIRKARVAPDQNVWDFQIGGSETEISVKRNCLALDQLALRPGVLVDVSEIDCSWEFFGKRMPARRRRLRAARSKPPASSAAGEPAARPPHFSAAEPGQPVQGSQ
jgi:hypothetical protein